MIPDARDSHKQAILPIVAEFKSHGNTSNTIDLERATPKQRGTQHRVSKGARVEDAVITTGSLITEKEQLAGGRKKSEKILDNYTGSFPSSWSLKRTT